MQDRYAGDVGDFGKLGLLRHLTAGSPPCADRAWYARGQEHERRHILATFDELLHPSG